MPTINGIGAQVQVLRDISGKTKIERVADVAKESYTAIDTLYRNDYAINQSLERAVNRIVIIENGGGSGGGGINQAFQEVPYTLAWTPDFSLSPRLKMTLTGPVTVITPGNYQEGQTLMIMFTQDTSVGSHGVGFDPPWRMPGDGRYAVSPDPGTITIYTFIVIDNIPRVVAFTAGLLL